MNKRRLIFLICYLITGVSLLGQSASVEIEDHYCLKIDNEYGSACQLRHSVSKPIILDAGTHSFELYYPTKGETVLYVEFEMKEGEKYKISRNKNNAVVKKNNEVVKATVRPIGIADSQVEKIKTLTPWEKKQTVQKTMLNTHSSESEIAYLHYYKNAKLTENAPLFVLYKVDSLWGNSGRFNYLAEGGFIIGIEPGKHKLEGISYASSVGDCRSREINGIVNCEAGKEYIIDLKGEGNYHTIDIVEKKE